MPEEGDDVSLEAQPAPETELPIEAGVGIDMTGDGKPDLWLKFKLTLKDKKTAAAVGTAVAIIIGVTKALGLW